MTDLVKKNHQETDLKSTVFEAFSDFFCCVYPSGSPGYYHCSNELGICFGFFI